MQSTELIMAVRDNDIERVSALIANGADVNSKDHLGNTALMLSCRNTEMVELLIANKANVNVKNNGGRTALMNAVCFRNPDIVKMLIANGVDINAKDDCGWTALMKALNARYTDTINILLEHISEMTNINAKTEEGYTALMLAEINGFTDVVALLKKAGAKDDQNKVNQKVKTTKLIQAVRDNDIERVSTLIANGADVNAKDFYGRTALMEGTLIDVPVLEGTKEGYIDIVKFLLEHDADVNIKDGYGQTALHHAKQDSNIAKLLLECGADVNAKDDSGETALISALHYGSIDTVYVLLEHISEMKDINAKTEEGYTALLLAEMKNYQDIVDLLKKAGAKYDQANITTFMITDIRAIELLVREGADVNAKNDYGRTALMRASELRDTEAVEFLIENKANVNSADNDGNTALMAAIQLNTICGDDSDKQAIAEGANIAKYLIAHGADVNAKNNDGNTILIEAVMSSCERSLIAVGAHANAEDIIADKAEIMKYLITHGADVNAKNNDGNTALMEAVISSRDTDIVKFLIAHGADVNAMNRYGATPLRIALKHRRKRIADLLKKAGAKQ